jgi:hypothetical protein
MPNNNKPPVRITLKKHNTLGRHGYKSVQDLAEPVRQVALLGAIAEFGATYVIRKLNVLAIFNKTKNPGLSAMFRRDIAFVQAVRNAAAPPKTKKKKKTNNNNNNNTKKPRRRRTAS